MSSRYTLDHDGRRIELESVSVGLGNVARLFVDGEQVSEAKTRTGRARLATGDLTVLIRWGWLGQVTRCVLVEEIEAGGTKPEVRETLLDPPPGTRAARLVRLARERPRLYAARHVLLAVLKLLVPLLGIGALLKLLPGVDLSWLWSWLPEVDWPQLPGWLSAILGAAKWWAPILVAVLIALREVERRRQKRDPRS